MRRVFKTPCWSRGFVSINGSSHKGALIDTRHTKLTPPMQPFLAPVFQIWDSWRCHICLTIPSRFPPFVTTAKQLLNARNVYQLRVTVQRRHHHPRGQSPMFQFCHSAPSSTARPLPCCMRAGNDQGVRRQAAAISTCKS